MCMYTWAGKRLRWPKSHKAQYATPPFHMLPGLQTIQLPRIAMVDPITSEGHTSRWKAMFDAVSPRYAESWSWLAPRESKKRHTPAEICLRAQHATRPPPPPQLPPVKTVDCSGDSEVGVWEFPLPSLDQLCSSHEAVYMDLLLGLAILLHEQKTCTRNV